MLSNLKNMDLNLGRFLLETRLTDIQKYRPSKPDSFGWLGTGTQYLKVDVLYRILSDFFGQSNIRMNNNDIYITPPPSILAGVKKVYFSGALDAIMTSYKFGDDVERWPSTAGVSFEGADGRDIKAIQIKQFGDLENILKTYWPDLANADTSIEAQSTIAERRVREWTSNPSLRQFVYKEIQQWFNMFLPYDSTPRVSDDIKAEINRVYQKILNDANCPSNIFDRILKLVAGLTYRHPIVDDIYYRAAVRFHTDRILLERRLRCDKSHF